MLSTHIDIAVTIRYAHTALRLLPSGPSYDALASLHGRRVVHDQLHLTERSAATLVDLVATALGDAQGAPGCPWRQAVRNRGWALRFASPRLRRDRGLVLEAARRRGAVGARGGRAERHGPEVRGARAAREPRLRLRGRGEERRGLGLRPAT